MRRDEIDLDQIDLETILPIELEELLFRAAHLTHIKDMDYITKDEAYQILEDNKKTEFARICEKQSADSNIAKERQALQSVEWSAWLITYQQARMIARRARAERDANQRLWETLRSILSSKNTSKKTGV